MTDRTVWYHFFRDFLLGLSISLRKAGKTRMMCYTTGVTLLPGTGVTGGRPCPPGSPAKACPGRPEAFPAIRNRSWPADPPAKGGRRKGHLAGLRPPVGSPERPGRHGAWPATHGLAKAATGGKPSGGKSIPPVAGMKHWETGMDSGDWDGDGGGASQHPATGQESRPTRDRPTINSARPRSAPPGQPAELNVDIVDNVDKRHGQPGQQSGQPDRVRGPIALRDRRPFGGMGQRPPVQARPSNVDTVDIVDRKGGGSGETDLGAALREIDILDGMSAGMPRQPVQDVDPSPTRLRNPVPVAPGSGTEPRGPSQDVVAAIRARAKARLGQRAAQAGTLPGAGSQPSKESPSPQARHGLTVSQATLDQYLRRGQQLVDRYRRERDLDVSIHEMSPTEWVNWLLSLKPGLKSSTWRMYRAAASHYLEGLPESAAAVAMLETDVIDRSRTPEAPSADGGKARRTSALKEKRFPVEDFERVVTYLKAFSRSKYAPVLIDWLRSGIFTGLRPSEWRTADLEVIGDPSAAYGRRA